MLFTVGAPLESSQKMNLFILKISGNFYFLLRIVENGPVTYRYALRQNKLIVQKKEDYDVFAFIYLFPITLKKFLAINSELRFEYQPFAGSN